MADKARGLTQGEIDLARSIFGNAIDYSKVQIHDGKIPGILESKFQPNDVAVPYDANNIYAPPAVYSDDFSKKDPGTFIHDMAYIWQFQNKITTPDDVKKWGLANRNNLEGVSEVTPDPAKDLKDYNVEQRARLIEDLYDYRRDQANPAPKAPPDPDGSLFLKQYAAAVKATPNSFIVKWAQASFNITQDAQGQYHLDPQKWAQGQANQRQQAANDLKEQQDTMKVLGRFIADPSYLTPGHTPAPTPAKPAAPPKQKAPAA